MKSISSTAYRHSRRDFLRHGVAATAAAVALPQFIPSGVLAADGQAGANDRINVGFIGIGRQAGGLLQQLLKQKDAKFIAVADVNLTRANEMKAKHGATPYQDFRRLLDNKDVDAIVTATPEHWRSNICIPACQAGKDLYAEKPVTLTIHEGRLMVEAARKYKRIFQVGSQQRSNWIDQQACKLVRDGGLGKVLKVYAPNYPSPWLNALPAQPVPAELDWEMWCGPSALVPYNKDLYLPRANPGWLSFRPYSGGEMTGWGAHGFDMIQFALGMDESGPTEVWVEGEKLAPPTYTQVETKVRGDKLCSVPKVFFRYANGIVMELIDQCPKPAFESNKVPGFGGIFECEKGTFKIDRGRVESNPDEIAIDLTSKRPRGLNDGHIRNWLDCIKSRKTPNADIEIGHRSATVCHLGNIARVLGRKLQWDPVKEQFVGDAEANTRLDVERRKPWVLPAKV
jgi:predicted dehydrogenase